MKTPECKINIAMCHWTKEQMYNMRFIASALEKKEFIVLTRNVSFKQKEEFWRKQEQRKYDKTSYSNL